MKDPNPYQSQESQPRSTGPADWRRTRWRWALIGFALGAAVPVAVGIHGMHQHSLSIASLGPNEAACGAGALAALAMMLVVGPFCGMIGAGAGWIASGIDWWAAL